MILLNFFIRSPILTSHPNRDGPMRHGSVGATHSYSIILRHGRLLWADICQEVGRLVRRYLALIL
jgi:hypothetical protein